MMVHAMVHLNISMSKLLHYSYYIVLHRLKLTPTLWHPSCGQGQHTVKRGIQHLLGGIYNMMICLVYLTYKSSKSGKHFSLRVCPCQCQHYACCMLECVFTEQTLYMW